MLRVSGIAAQKMEGCTTSLRQKGLPPISRIDVAYGASDIPTVRNFWLAVAGMGETA